jgi:alpha-tubulin suppressor-like RCC1 family protein
MNNVKEVIQKEEYISLAINKYILQTAKIPKKSDGSNDLDWEKLLTEDYLGANFNKTNPLTSKDIVVNFDSNNNAFIKGVIESEAKYKEEHNYLYNFYINKVFRVNTIPPSNITKEKLYLGSEVLYNNTQKEIIKILNETNHKDIKLSNQTCVADDYFYELKNEKLTYKFCRADYSFDVYQESPIYLEKGTAPLKDLEKVIANIGDKAFIKDGSSWYEYYYQGGDASSAKWIASGMGNALTSVDDTINIEDRILSYIPDSKDLVLRRDGGCMLANGDIFCWGNNQYKKAGIESYGQLDTSLKPDYVNTPVMLKVQIDNIEVNNETLDLITKKWYNNPYRVKFEKMAMNSSNVCGISPLFNYFDGTQKKFGGELYCNGQITNLYFENIASGTSETSILSKNKFFAWGKSDQRDDTAQTIKISEDGGPIVKDTAGQEINITRDEIYLTDIVMVEDTIAVLSDAGKIYTIGRNYKGTLGIGSNDKFLIQLSPEEVKSNDVVFKKIFALRDIATFGAIDTNNFFYIWGERPNGTIYYEPTLVSDSTKFNSSAIFTNSKDFILKGANNKFYRTTGNKEIIEVSNIPSSAISASIYDKSSELYLYANENMELKGSSEFLICKESAGVNCVAEDSNIFNLSLAELNSFSNTFNGKDYANFANVSIYQLDTVKTEIIENFENGSSAGWDGSSINKTNGSIRVTSVTDDGTDEIPVTKFLGNFNIEEVEYGSQPATDYVNRPSYIEKTFSIGSTYANNEVELEFDFYEIDTWDFERFTVTLNDVIFVEDNFIHDNHPYLNDVNDTGESLQKVASSGSYNNDNDERYHYKLRTKLDSLGNLKIRFSTRGLNNNDIGYNGWSFAQSSGDESWGIDNIHIKVKETSKTFVCAMTGFGSASQMYCWGNVGRSIPILSTSLYDMSKIDSINKLFISQESEKTKQMSFTNFDNNGNLFLRYPTYIGGFDYPFYFK